jgi:hypothetical protein
MTNENWTDNTETNEDATFLTQEEYDVAMKVIPVDIKDVRTFRAGFELVEYEAGYRSVRRFLFDGFRRSRNVL